MKKQHCSVCGFSFLKEEAPRTESFEMRFFCPGCPLSHVAAVSLEVKDLAALDKACQRLGLELRLGQTTYRWWGVSVGDYPLPEGFTKDDLGHCNHAIAVKGNDRAYEVGVVQRRDGRPGYILHWDFYAGGYGLEAVVGANCGKLKQAYAIEAAKSKARQQGFGVVEKREASGRIQLVCTKG